MPRTTIEYRVASKTNYNEFCKEHPELKLTYVEWQNIIYTYLANFRDHILETGDKVKMIYGFGDFSISKKKPNKYKTSKDGQEYINLPINWKKTKESGKKVYHLNYHSNGYKFKWKWFIESTRFYKSDIWVFKASRITSRLINHYVNLGENYQDLYKEWETV